MRHRRLWPGDVRDRVHHGGALGDRVVRAERAQEFILEVKAKEAAKLQPKIEALLRRRRVKYELREAKPEEFSYMVEMPMDVKTDALSAEIMALDPDPGTGVEWKTDKNKKKAPEAVMELIVEPEDGLTPLIAAIKKATKQIDVTVFRFDLKELQKALESAVTRGVKVHALIAHTTGGGAKRLRKLELDLLAAGVTVSRTDDDLVRYHNKMLLIDRETLYTLAFNFTRLDIEKSRSMASRPRTRPSSPRPSSCSKPIRRGSPTPRIATVFSSARRTPAPVSRSSSGVQERSC